MFWCVVLLYIFRSCAVFWRPCRVSQNTNYKCKNIKRYHTTKHWTRDLSDLITALSNLPSRSKHNTIYNWLLWSNTAHWLNTPQQDNLLPLSLICMVMKARNLIFLDCEQLNHFCFCFVFFFRWWYFPWLLRLCTDNFVSHHFYLYFAFLLVLLFEGEKIVYVFVLLILFPVSW